MQDRAWRLRQNDHGFELELGACVDKALGDLPVVPTIRVRMAVIAVCTHRRERSEAPVALELIRLGPLGEHVFDFRQVAGLGGAKHRLIDLGKAQCLCLLCR